MPDLGDQALTDPREDLLAVAPAAEQLARMMAVATLPYTVGIYGGWGEGKTTFAAMVLSYLQKQPGWEDLRPVRFSAWPYVTADAVWRALLDAIARAVYEPKDAGGPAAKPAPGLRGWLRSRLENEVIPAATTDPRDARTQKYERLMKQLGRTTALATRDNRDAETARQVSLLAGLVLDVVSSVATPAGSLRRVLGLGSESFGSPAATAPAADRVLTSVEEARAAVRELFDDATKPRTVIIVDDLDRCMPEVALDVLETIKIFLSESTEAGAGCAFIVAVDQSVLTRALTKRLEVEDPAGARAYLEKVIQFGLSMTAIRAAAGPGRLVAAQYPEWNGALDLLAMATDANPRRLRQQCELLSYGFNLIEERP